MTRLFTSRWAYAAAVVWLLLTVSLAAWWLIFALGQVSQLLASGGLGTDAALRVERMLLWEGFFFLLLLVCGGILLLVAIRREAARRAAVEAFFMAFTHDLKTALTSLQLQAESIEEDLPDAAGNPNLQRLKKDAVRLQLQLENSLYYAQPTGELHPERLSLRQLVQQVAVDWPELRVEITGDAEVIADDRALAVIVRNLLQNAVVHGQSRVMSVHLDPPSGGHVLATFADDGCGAPEHVIRALAARGAGSGRGSGSGSGSGMGLVISQRLMARMRGAIKVRAGVHGVLVLLQLPAAA